VYTRRYNQEQDEEKEKLTLYCSSLFYMFTFARRVFFSVNDNVERKQNKRRCTRSPYFVTQARARAHAREWRKGKETKKKKEKEEEGEEERYMHGRRVAMIYENKSIETHSLCVAMVLLCREEEREREKKKKKMAMFITCRRKSSLRKVQISSANAFNDNDGL